MPTRRISGAASGFDIILLSRVRMIVVALAFAASFEILSALAPQSELSVAKQKILQLFVLPPILFLFGVGWPMPSSNPVAVARMVLSWPVQLVMSSFLIYFTLWVHACWLRVYRGAGH
jgi:hypothetical protein